MMIETDWIKKVIRDYWKTILSANIKPSDFCHLHMSAKSFFINLGLWLFPQIKLIKFCPSIPITLPFYIFCQISTQCSVSKWGWLVQRSCFGQLAIPRTILEISLVSLLGKRCFSSTRNSLSLTILLHEHICPIFDFFVIFWPIMTWCTQLHADLFLPFSHLAQVWYSRPSYIKLQKLWSNIYVRSLE